jgi:hypothetical protein
MSASKREGWQSRARAKATARFSASGRKLSPCCAAPRSTERLMPAMLALMAPRGGGPRLSERPPVDELESNRSNLKIMDRHILKISDGPGLTGYYS